MAADDYLNNPSDQGFPDQGFPTDVDPASSMSGNRPASGARRATPGEVLSQGFQGAQNAGDFLGLDVEFAGNQDPNQVYGGGPLDLVAPPGTYSDDADAQGVPMPAPLPEGDPVQEFAQAPSAFEFGGDLGADEGEAAFSPEESSRSRTPLFVGALLVAALSVGGVMYGPTLYSRYFGSAVEVASAKPEPARPTTKARPGESSTPSAEATPTAETSSAPLAESTATPEPASKPEARVAPTPRARPEPAPVASSGARSTSEPTPAEARPSVPPTVVATEAPTAAVRPQALSFPDLDGSEYAWASEDQLELIWRGSEVPLEALTAPAKTLMPRVGQVRVFTISGDVFDGRLYAVGQNRVWIDSQPGRVGLDGSQVERIEVLPPQAEGLVKSAVDLDATGGKRVRVRVPGGMLYGRVLKSEGDEVTLALDDGGRVRVKAADLQELGSSRAVVVRR